MISSTEERPSKCEEKSKSKERPIRKDRVFRIARLSIMPLFRISENSITFFRSKEEPMKRPVPKQPDSLER